MNQDPSVTHLPAVLGGIPAFESATPIVRPDVPDLADLSGELGEMLHSGMLTKGKHLTAFERAVAEHLQVKHAIGVSSCTSGLMLVYRCLGLSGQAVVPSFTFMATVSSLVWSGLRPVFADIDPRTTNLDPASAEAAVTSETTALVAVHNMGNPADIDALAAVAQRHRLKLVFDAAHGFGSLFRGHPLGSQGDAQVFSLSPTKLVIAAEGGIVTTNDDALAERIHHGREYGMGKGYDSLFAGLNARMSELHALVGRKSLLRLDRAVARRHEIASLYRHKLAEVPGITPVHVRPDDRCSYKDFSVLVDASASGISRTALARALAAENIDTRTYYDPPAHMQTAYRKFAPPAGSLVNTQRVAEQILSLPIWSIMDEPTATRIVQAIERIVRHGPAVESQLEKLSQSR
jgi:dTDP-4-amino-4,6-dideoxygalactose transaminase